MQPDRRDTGANTEQTAAIVGLALQVGYRHIDTAQHYGTERGVGQASFVIEPIVMRREGEQARAIIAPAYGVSRAALNMLALRFPGVVYRRFADPEPTGILGLAFHSPRC